MWHVAAFASQSGGSVTQFNQCSTIIIISLGIVDYNYITAATLCSQSHWDDQMATTEVRETLWLLLNNDT